MCLVLSCIEKATARLALLLMLPTTADKSIETSSSICAVAVALQEADRLSISHKLLCIPVRVFILGRKYLQAPESQGAFLPFGFAACFFRSNDGHVLSMGRFECLFQHISERDEVRRGSTQHLNAKRHKNTEMNTKIVLFLLLLQSRLENQHRREQREDDRNQSQR